jgi:penicillin-binding protein A
MSEKPNQPRPTRAATSPHSKAKRTEAQKRNDLLRRRAIPVALVAGLAFLFGAIAGASSGSAGEDEVRAYAQAWSKADWATMHAQLTTQAQESTPLLDFAQSNRTTLATATAAERSVRAGEPKEAGDGRWRVPLTIRTRIFGTVRGEVVLQTVEDGDNTRIAWIPSNAFPDLRPGQQLTRNTTMPERGSLLTKDGQVLAEGAARTSSIPAVSNEVVGQIGPIPAERALETNALGIPPDAQVGISGLELIFQPQLAGRPSGTLRAGNRVIARSAGSSGDKVRTTIVPSVEQAAISAMVGRQGGVVAMNPRNGAIEAFAGQAFSLLQPPGSTFKVVSTAGALDAGVASTKSTYPFMSGIELSGFRISNAGGEVCGGTLGEAFAESCNSVFAPLGAKLGEAKLVAAAQRFGFNRISPIPGAAQSTIPLELGDDLNIGSSAIGQGKVQASTLQMTLVAATVARRGRLVTPTLSQARADQTKASSGAQAIKASTAKILERFMIGVVRGGTGTAAAIPGVTVAGKTGTAELRSPSENPEDTDAWFIAFAPAGKKKIASSAVGVMFVGAGTGGETAAPAAQGVLSAMLAQR